ncbi:MAG: ABC transporter substrate-binding protein, partial [Clostridiales Family XIII bacterium]|nr:ABC transporter substrate-binding protein [Clostridiales Family XIII bacterium]
MSQKRRSKERRIISLILAAMLILCASMFAACTGGGGDETPDTPDANGDAQSGVKAGGTVIVGQSAEPITLNPDGKMDDNLPAIAQNVFHRLMKTNNKQEVILDLAADYSVSEDGTEYTFTLPDNVTFHDGEKLTSDDVKFTFEELIKQVGQASASFECIEEISCPDDATVVFKLKRIETGFLDNLAYNGAFILPRHVYAGKDWNDADSMMTPIGSGPFKFVDWNKGVSITLERYENFCLGEGLPYLDKIVFSYISDSNTAMQSFYNGDLDILGIIAPSSEYDKLLNDPAIISDKVIYPSRFYVGFNQKDDLMKDINFRLAVAHAIDSDDMINKALKQIGQKATAYLSPVFEWAVNSDSDAAVPAFDLDKAKDYLEKTGLKADGNGIYATVDVDTYNYEPFPELALVLKDQLSKIGIDVKINMLEYAAWEEKVGADRNFTMTLEGGYQGPDVGAVAQRVKGDGILNYYNYDNPELNALLEEGETLPTHELRAPIYR